MRHLQYYLYVKILHDLATATVYHKIGELQSANQGRSVGAIGPFYQIFVPSFADGNGDGIGDLKGIASKLDYLEYLGIKGIWLSPIHPSPSYHKYDVVDYYGVDPAYGTTEDAEELFRACHAHGIRILLDLVLNCSSDRHPAFIKALSDPTSPERRRYRFSDTPGAERLDRNAVWNGLPVWHTAQNREPYMGIYAACMPDYNFDDEGLREECFRIADFWLEKGVDGFRLDSAMHLYHPAKVAPGEPYHEKNIAWWQSFRAHCRSVKPDCFLIGEVWDESAVRAPYHRGLDSTFHFYLGERIRRLTEGTLAANDFSAYLAETYRTFASVDPSCVDAPFLSNHDMLRYAEETGFSADMLKLSAAVYLTLPGVPFVYYGEELGLSPEPNDRLLSALSSDGLMRARTAFPWTEGQCVARFAHGYRSEPLKRQLTNPDSMLRFYRRMLRLRNELAPLRDGVFVPISAPDGVLAYRMQDWEEFAEVFHNLSDAPVAVVSGLPLAVDPMAGAAPQKGSDFGSWILLPKRSIIFYKNEHITNGGKE